MLKSANARASQGRAGHAVTQPMILTVQEVAAYLRLHAVTVYRMAQNGELPAFRVGRRWRFKRDQIEQWLTDRHNDAAPAPRGIVREPQTGRPRAARR